MTQIITIQDGTPVSAPSGCDDCVAYAAPSLVSTIYGAQNVQKWADVDDVGDAGNPMSSGFQQNQWGPGGAVEARIAWSLCLATSTLNGRLQDSIYQIPFIAPVPCLVQDACARLAGCFLYDSRRITDTQEDAPNSSSPHRKMVNDFIRGVRAGKVRLAGAVQLGTTVPVTEKGYCNGQSGYQGWVNGNWNPEAVMYLPFIWRPVVIYPAPCFDGLLNWMA